MEEILLLAFLFMIAGIIAVPIASRLGLGSVLGYLLAGIALSPLLRQLGVDVVSIQHFAEFGVVMMLFIVGLELEPRILWQMKTKLLGLGGLQVLLTTLAVHGACHGAGTALEHRPGNRPGIGTLIYRHRIAESERKRPEPK